MAKGRAKVQVNETNFKLAVLLAEQNGPLNNRNALYEEVIKHYNAVEQNHIKACLVPLRLAEFKIEVKTPVGQRGRPAGVKNKATVATTNEVKTETTITVIDAPTVIVEDETIETAVPFHEEQDSLEAIEAELAIA